MGLAAYKQTIRESETPRQIERRILARLTYELGQHAPAFDGAETKSERISVLHGGLRATIAETQKFWGLLRDDLAEPTNALPETLRAGLISLALFVDRQCAQILAGDGRVAPLAEINANVAAGLAGQPSLGG